MHVNPIKVIKIPGAGSVILRSGMLSHPPRDVFWRSARLQN